MNTSAVYQTQMDLYKLDSKGRIRILTIIAKDDKLIQESGLIDGKKVKHEKVCKAKNVGKSNETTPEEQAIAEANALVTKKLKERYYRTQDQAKADVVKLPMLAKAHNKVKKPFYELKDIVALQPKLDGIRCLITYDPETKQANAISRKNRPFENIEHILTYIESTLEDCNEKIIFDGELYVHGKTFQEITKLVKNKPNFIGNVEYHIYDIIDEELDYISRLNKLTNLFTYTEDNGIIYLVDTYLHKTNDSELSKQHDIYISKGYEGMMIRNPESKYKVNGRSDDLLKYKTFKDIALTIIDITPNDARPTQGTVWVEYNGQKQKVGNKLSHEDAEDLLNNKTQYIGKTGEIRYFEETDDGKLRFPHFHGIRIDK